ncbi:MAG: DUF5615 family PIN-like protein [Verrucomicrobiaceae bacterium]|jgi:hypothetical protein|nr:DUF5615 family PIN-like protein [Verrucomicrobiaceae bacterium]
MARIYSNENFHREVVIKLRELGHDVLTSLEAGKANQGIPDEEVLAFAIQEARVLLTFNRLHFQRLHRQSAGKHAGIIVCRMNNDTSGLALRIHEAVLHEKSLEGQLLRVNRPQA